MEFDIARGNGLPVVEINRTDINLCPTNTVYVRPKWGRYRSLDDSENLKVDEERVRYANFSITKLRTDD